MKVLQLIDSLNAGGAERMAVNIANGLASYGQESYLCTTREEGLLKESLSNNVNYAFLKKKTALDVNAIRQLHSYIKTHEIEIIHAHSTSFFLGTLLKILNPKIILIWHDHYGKSEFLENRSSFILKSCSFLFSHTLTVNTNLELWNKNVLKVKSVSYLPNFATYRNENPITELNGIKGKRIICLANLRPQKDHINLLNAFKEVVKHHSDWTLHLVGHDFKDDYSQIIKAFIKENGLHDHVFIYGSCPDVSNILSQGTIGILSSKSEGLPVALLEYGLAKLPVVATDVGDCAKVISNSSEGLLVQPGNHKALAEALAIYINEGGLRTQVAENFQKKVTSSFSEESVIQSLLRIYKSHQK